VSSSGKIALLMLLWLVWIAAVVTGELLPGDSSAMQWISASHISDKLLHFTAYLGIAVVPALMYGTRVGSLAATLATALGVALEVVQRWVGRDFEVGDMAANAAGAFVGLALGLAIRAAVSGKRVRTSD
jgi:VanZ family protein